MTRLCVSIFVVDPVQVQRDVALAAERGADLVELRIDEFTDPERVRALVRGCRMPCIVTCRPTWEGGSCELPEEQRLAVLAAAAEASPAYLDVELKAVDQFAGLETGVQRPTLVVSSHDFTGRPPRLYNILTDLAQSPADVAKIVWTARTIRDNLEAFEILQRATRPTIALCMGEAGLISRVLAKKFGAFLTFCGLRDAQVTAPGQVSVDTMKRLYRWNAIGPRTRVYGVVASPVAHSMSPAIHNSAFDATGHDGVYLPMLVNEGYESFKAFAESFAAFQPLDLAGLSVTIPHKANALKYLEEKNAEIDPLARRIGAVNTIALDRSPAGLTLRGTNTDYGAILDSVTAALGIPREALSDYRVGVIGAGGTGRSAVAAFAQYGATVVVYNRTRDRADALAAEFTGGTGKVVAAPLEKLPDSCCRIYVNTTSIGMHPDIDASPFADGAPKLGPGSLVFDAIYNPRQTRLLREAAAAGAKTVSGVEMFVRQAAAQFEFWTHRPAPAQVMRETIERMLA